MLCSGLYNKAVPGTGLGTRLQYRPVSHVSHMLQAATHGNQQPAKLKWWLLVVMCCDSTDSNHVSQAPAEHRQTVHAPFTANNNAQWTPAPARSPYSAHSAPVAQPLNRTHAQKQHSSAPPPTAQSADSAPSSICCCCCDGHKVLAWARHRLLCCKGCGRKHQKQAEG